MAYTPGRYRGRVSKTALTQNENSKNYQVVLQFELVGRYDAQGQLETCDPSTRTVWRVLTDKTVERVAQELRALGFTGGSWVQIDEEQAGNDFVDLRNVECDLQMRIEAYQGVDRERWELSVLGGMGANVGKSIERKQAREVDAKFGKALKATPPPAKTAPRTAPTAATAPSPSNDEIPF